MGYIEPDDMDMIEAILTTFGSDTAMRNYLMGHRLRNLFDSNL